MAAQEGYVAMSQGQLAYVVGNVAPASGYRLFREPQPLYDFDTKELLGYESRYVGTAEFVRPGMRFPGGMRVRHVSFPLVSGCGSIGRAAGPSGRAKDSRGGGKTFFHENEEVFR